MAKAIFVALGLLIAITYAHAFTTIRYNAVVVEVTDGDTIVVSIDGFPVPFNPIAVRFNGIDTPESRFGVMGAKCALEKELGLQVKIWMKEKLPPGSKVTIIWSGIHEKYGRLLGNVLFNGEDLSNTLISKGWAVPYFGQTKVKNWCKK